MNSSIFKSILLGTALALASNLAVASPITKKVVRRIANQEITKRAPSLRGAAGPVGATGPAGPAAVQLYARILRDDNGFGFVVPSRSFGITQDNVFLDVDGTTYCFTGLPPINGAQVTVDHFETSSNETAKFGLSGPPGCEAFVKVFDGSGNETLGGFFIILY